MNMFYVILILLSLCELFENITCECILVMKSKEENENSQFEQNHLPIYFGFRALGSLFGGFLGG
jgi:hypothetical protein